MDRLIKDTDFVQILKSLKTIKSIHTNDIDRLRLFFESIYYIAKTSCQWRLLPSYYGSWRAIHKRFKKWSNKKIWEKIFESFKVDPDLEWVTIDSTIIRAHACAAGYGKNSQDKEALGRSKGGFTTKVHAVTDALGNPLFFVLTPGQRNDITQAHNLTENIPATSIRIADKAYDADHFTQGNNVCIPPRNNRKNPRDYDEHLYENRFVIECFFGKIKHFRRIFSRFDKSAASYLSFLHFVSAFIWMR